MRASAAAVLRPRLAIFVAACCLFAVCATPAFPQKTVRTAAATTPEVKKPTIKLPPLKSPEDKLKFLEAIRQSMPINRPGAKTVAYTSADLDKSLEFELRPVASDLAPPASDEVFLRRVSIDLTGALPTDAAVRAFVADTDRHKRSKKIDELVASKDYARNWAKFWRHIIFFGTNAPRNRTNPQALEDWLAAQFEKNVRWDHVVSELVSATPKPNKEKKDDFGQNVGQNNFVLACENKADELATQTARLFMGISIQCAECHDHPFDQWKREQFHEMAAFFAPGKYYMTDQRDPTKKTQMQARFLLGEKPPADLNADARRVAVAAYLIYNQDNYWFARAYVNRVWSELMGDGFYSVDSLGPDKDVTHKLIVNRIASVFRYKDFDSKWLFRLIMNSQTYQREIRTISDDAKLFTAVRPSRIRADQLTLNLRRFVGENQGLERNLVRTFDLDPALPQRDVEGSIQQALILMNNGTIHGQLAKSALRKKLVETRDDGKMLDDLYLGVLARFPTKNEKDRATTHLKKVGNRNEAIDDLLWVLLNSAEFLTKR